MPAAADDDDDDDATVAIAALAPVARVPPSRPCEGGVMPDVDKLRCEKLSENDSRSTEREQKVLLAAEGLMDGALDDDDDGGGGGGGNSDDVGASPPPKLELISDDDDDDDDDDDAGDNDCVAGVSNEYPFMPRALRLLLELTNVTAGAV